MDSQSGGLTPSPRTPVRNPWITTGVTGVVALGLVVAAASMSGSGSAGSPQGGGPPVMPTMPTLPGLSTKAPGNGPANGPTGKTPPGRGPTQSGAKHDWNSATGDTTVFTADEWFPEKGAHTVETRAYQLLDKRDNSCMAAEPDMRTLMKGTCVKVIQSVWANDAKTHVGSLSVVSLSDKRAAEALQDQLADDRSKGQYIRFITPPSSSGVRFSEKSPTWVSTTVSGHYLVISEVARSDGKARDDTSRAMVNDMREVAMQHANAVWRSGG